MKKETKRKALYWGFKGGGIVSACAFPLWAIFEKFPIWTETHGAGTSIGVGGIIGLLVILVVFRKTIFNYLKERLTVKHAPPITIWVVLIIISYILMFVNKFLYDISTVFWMGLVGSGLGTFLTFIGDSKFGKPKVEEKPNERA